MVTPPHVVLLRVLSAGFFDFGVFIDRHPKRVIALSLSASLLCMVGLIWLPVMVDYEELWCPKTTESYGNKLVLEQHFGKPDRRLVILVTAPPRSADANMLSLPRLLAAQAVHDLVTGVPGYEKLCSRAFAGGPCLVSSVLSAWNFSSAQLASSNVTETLSPSPAANRGDSATVLDLRLNRPLVMATVVGGTGPGGVMAGSPALQMVFMLNNAPMDTPEHTELEEYEGRVLELLQANWPASSGGAEEFPHDIEVIPMAGRSCAHCHCAYLSCLPHNSATESHV